MGRLSIPPGTPKPRGTDLTVIRGDGFLVAQFSGYVDGSNIKPRGDMVLRLGVPFEQIPNVMPVMQQIGGALFEVSMRRVPFEELPESGWT